MLATLKQNLNLGSCQARSLKKQEAHIAFVLLGFVTLEIQPTMQFNSDIAKTVGEKKRLLSSLLLVKKEGKHAVINIHKSNSKGILWEHSFLSRVKVSLDFAFKTLNYRKK